MRFNGQEVMREIASNGSTIERTVISFGASFSENPPLRPRFLINSDACASRWRILDWYSRGTWVSFEMAGALKYSPGDPARTTIVLRAYSADWDSI